MDLETSVKMGDLLTDSKKIADIILAEFRTVLSEPEMDYDDDFFDFGGHSLLATRVIGKLIQHHHINISFNDFFVSPTAKGLAQKVSFDNLITAKQRSQELLASDSAPLSFAQDFLWQAYKYFNFDVIYNLPFAIKFHDYINEDLMFKAFTDVLERHASLRTLFKTIEGTTTQYVVPVSNVAAYKWYWSSEESKGFNLESEATYRFNLAKELPIRVCIFHDALDGKQILSLLVHHMAIDEWSLNLLMTDLKFAYHEYSAGKKPKWEQPANNMLEFANLQQKQGVNKKHLEYWVNLLMAENKTNNNENELSQFTTSTEADSLKLDFSPETYSQLMRFSKQYQISLFAILYTLITISLLRAKDLESIIIGTSASGRMDADFFDTVGYFTTMVAHPISFNQQKPIVDLIKETAKLINGSMMYADIPINIIQDNLGLNIHSELMFDAYIHIHTNNALYGTFNDVNGSKIYYEQIPPQKTVSMFGLHFEIMDNVTEDNQHLFKIIITYQKQRYDKQFIETLSSKIAEITKWVAIDHHGIHQPLEILNI